MLSAPSPDDDVNSPSFRDPGSSMSLPELPSIEDLVSYIPTDQDEVVVTLTLRVSRKNGSVSHHHFLIFHFFILEVNSNGVVSVSCPSPYSLPLVPFLGYFTVANYVLEFYSTLISTSSSTLIGVHVFPPVISSSDSDTASLPSFKQCIKPPVREQNPASQSDVATRNNNGESADSTLTSSMTSVEKPPAQPLSKDDALKARLAALQKLMKRKRENAAISSAMNTDDIKSSSLSANFSTGIGNSDDTDSLVSKKMKFTADKKDDTAFVRSSDVASNQSPTLNSVDNGPTHQTQFAESCSSSMRPMCHETVRSETKLSPAAPLPTGPIVVSPLSAEVESDIQSGDISECRDACRIWVGNLPSTCTISQLRRFFEPFGQVKDAIIIKDKESQQSKGFGFVEFMDANSAERALEMNGELQMSNRLVRIGRAVRPGTVIAPPTANSSSSLSMSSNSKSATAFISGLTSDVTSALIVDAFRNCGEIADIRIIQDRSTRKCKGVH
ncbi:hypothetical protein BKA69DRAFT_835805 [Paraphysoderma sedebokerense]|nr:hypothetical protein BKA69DRAFT_835805 [Paraphysoderma sedebokerense]